MKTLLKAKKGILFKASAVALFFLFSASPAFAGFCDVTIVPCGTKTTSICNFCHIFALINNVISFIITCVAPILATLFLVLGGLMMLTSTGNATAFTKAKKVIEAVIMGLVIIFLSWAFINTFFTYIGVSEWTGLDNWWQIKCAVN